MLHIHPLILSLHVFWCGSRLFVCHLCIWHTSASRKRFPALALPKRRLSEHQYWHANPVARVVCLLSLSVSFSLFFSVSWEVCKVRSAVLERVKVCITPHSCVFPPTSFSKSHWLFVLSTHRTQGGTGVEESCAQLHAVQQQHGLPQLEHTATWWEPGVSTQELGDGLYRDGHGLLYRVSPDCQVGHLLGSTVVLSAYKILGFGIWTVYLTKIQELVSCLFLIVYLF